jgi:hypothetical protein
MVDISLKPKPFEFVQGQSGYRENQKSHPHVKAGGSICLKMLEFFGYKR